MDNLTFSIAAVERDTGLSKDVLRMWERRYGFPLPVRDANGERGYPIEQVERLRLIKRLMDQGHRPGKLIGASPEELQTLAPRRAKSAHTSAARLTADTGNELAELAALIKAHDIVGYQQAMQQHIARKGLHNFVQDTVAPLSNLIGDEWERGTIAVFEEHLFTELTKRLLRQAIASLPGAKGSPRVLLTSVPEEQHGIGLLMAEVMFTLEGAECIPLGTESPLLEIAKAATAHRADIVALSFSTAFPARKIAPTLQQLRQLLPESVDLWAGGSGVYKVAAGEGINLLAALDAIGAAVNGWRQGREVLA